MLWANVAIGLAVGPTVIECLRYSPEHEGYNLNENKDAIHPVDYWGQWENHTYHPSPANWRMPFYDLEVDRFVDGDPTNNEANGTVFEHSWMSNQFRFGGDVKGLQDNMDYLQGMGIKVDHLLRLARCSTLTDADYRFSIYLGARSSTCHGLATDTVPWILHFSTGIMA